MHLPCLVHHSELARAGSSSARQYTPQRPSLSPPHGQNVCSLSSRPGLGDAEDRLAPTSVATLAGASISAIACGAEYTLAISASQQRVYAWGWCAAPTCGFFTPYHQRHCPASALLTPVRNAAAVQAPRWQLCSCMHRSWVSKAFWSLQTTLRDLTNPFHSNARPPCDCQG